MGRKAELFELSGGTYRVTQLGAEEGSELWDEILAALGSKVVEKVQSLGDLEGKGEDELLAKIGPIVLELLAAIPKDLKRRLRAAFRRSTELQAIAAGEEPVWLPMKDLFDEHFAGKYGAMMAWEMACMKHNFADFLPSGRSQDSSKDRASKTTKPE